MTYRKSRYEAAKGQRSNLFVLRPVVSFLISSSVFFCHDAGMLWRSIIKVILVVLILGAFFWGRRRSVVPTPVPSVSVSQDSLTGVASVSPEVSAVLSSPSPAVTPPPVSSFHEPVSDFKQRITKKMFGTYVTPQDSPVSPERFTGYHTGVDAEFSDRSDDVAVTAIADGTVLAAQQVSGYGGAVVVHHSIAGQDRAVVYGHLDPGRLPKIGQTVKSGDLLGYLGQGNTSQTDGERKHLHLAILKTTTINWKGYVANKADLANWLNPLDYF